MATDFDRQIILDLLLTPTTFALEVLGMGAAALAGLDVIGPWGYLVGIGGVLGGIGWGITRVILNPEKVVGDSMQKKKDRRLKAKDLELDAFDKKLTDHKDWEVRASFRELRAIYKEFLRLSGTIMDALREEMEEQFMELFDTCFKSLGRAHDNLLSVRQMEVDRIKRPFLDRRAKTMASIKVSIDQMTTFVTGIAEASDTKDDTAMNGLHDSLRDNLNIMKAVDDEMSDFMTSKTYE
jgi:hypothetical protein